MTIAPSSNNSNAGSCSTRLCVLPNTPRARKLLWSGRLVDLEHPRVEDIDFEDIEHSLARQSRFGGHGQRGATVAQHSVHVSRICPPHLARWALLHDAAECYLGDMSTEMKRLLPYFKELERRWEDAVALVFGVPIDNDVKHWDTVSLLTERRDNGPWGISDAELLGVSEAVAEQYMLDPKPYVIWEPAQAEYEFHARALELGITKCAI